MTIQQADVNHTGSLDDEGFRRFIKSISGRPDLEAIFKAALPADAHELNQTAFEKFLQEHQGVYSLHPFA